ncbi:MAG TPA: DUF1552 domain-containing protein [Polyangia bacterium]|jgi:hypothetical protein|nr:DUF1552 domain-containing protein [Polyangia bacterium]
MSTRRPRRPEPLSPTRRSFLKAVGAAGAALPFYQLLEDSVARAAGDPQPLRFVTLYHPHGIAAEYFVMQAGDTETAFDLGFANSVLQPFDDAGTYGRSFKDKLLLVEGVDLLSNANGHDSAGTILTGSRIDSSASKPLNSSLDQFLAVEKGLGAATPITSLALGVGNDGTQAGATLSFGPGGAPLPKMIDPVQVFNLLFASFVPSNDPAEQAAAMRRRKLGQSVIDFVRGDINRLQPRLAAPEKQKLDQHLSALGDLEKQLGGIGTGGGPTCVAPGKPDKQQFPSLKQYNGGEPYFDAITNAHIDLIAHAFSCDITRFATLYMNDLSYSGNPLGLPADNHGSVAHTYSGSPVGSDGHPSGPGDPATWALLGKFNRYCYAKVALLMQKLDQLGVLDNVLIYVSSDMGNPSLHSTRNVPTVLAGGANGAFRMGRRIKAAADCPTNSPWCGPSDAVFNKTGANNHLLVSIAQAFGVAIDTFGTQTDTAYTTGALAGLK